MTIRPFEEHRLSAGLSGDLGLREVAKCDAVWAIHGTDSPAGLLFAVIEYRVAALVEPFGRLG